MSRLTIPAADAMLPAAQPRLGAVNAQLGLVQNLIRLVGGRPAALEGLRSLSGALGRTLDITTAHVKGCDDCLSAHSDLRASLAS